jgi:hypothetical protein
VNIYWEQCHYFHSKDAAFEYLWQIFLNSYEGYDEDYDEGIAKAYQELNESYRISGLGEVQVCGFED